MLKYWGDKRIERFKSELARVSTQLSDFYGPLFAVVRANQVAWQTFSSEFNLSWSKRSPPTREEKVAWLNWMSRVFMPANIQMRDIIVGKAHLLREVEMPDCLIELCAHVAAANAILEDLSPDEEFDLKTLIAYPQEELLEYTARSFGELKRQQLELIGKLAKKKQEGEKQVSP